MLVHIGTIRLLREDPHDGRLRPRAAGAARGDRGPGLRRPRPDRPAGSRPGSAARGQRTGDRPHDRLELPGMSSSVSGPVPAQQATGPAAAGDAGTSDLPTLSSERLWGFWSFTSVN